jgi:hypothetical protein
LVPELVLRGWRVTVVDDLSCDESRESEVFKGPGAVEFVYRRVEDTVSRSELWTTDCVVQLAHCKRNSKLQEALANITILTATVQAIARWRPDRAVFVMDDVPTMSLIEQLREERGLDVSEISLANLKGPKQAAKVLIRELD